MRVTYRPDPGESTRSALLVAGSQSKGNVWWILLGIFALTALAARVLVPDAWLAVTTLAFAGLLAAFRAVQAEYQWRQGRLLAADPHLAEEHALDLTSAGLQSACSHMTVQVPWSAITRVQETTEFYLFWYGPRQALPVAKRILTDEEDAALRAIVRAEAQDRGAGLALERPLPAGAIT